MKPVADRLRTMAGSRECEALAEGPAIAWGRAGDLVVGVVEVNIDRAQERITEAYDLLDESGALLPHELWSVVLVVIILGERGEASSLARQVERDLRRSRKIAVVEDAHLPNLFSGIGGQELPAVAPPADVVSIALDQMADGELRQALDVLLEARRPSDDVDALIRLLGSEDKHV